MSFHYQPFYGIIPLMGRTLSETLKAQQKWALITRPYIKVELFDKWGGINRHRWSELYSGEEEDYFHSACFAGDGSLIRVRADLATHHRWYQRITSPGPGSDFSQWQDWGEWCADIAVCALNAEVLVYIVVENGDYYQRKSTDYGATFGGWSLMGNIGPLPANCRLAACFKANGDVLVLYSLTTQLNPQPFASYTKNLPYKTSIYGDEWKSQGFSPSENLTLAAVRLKLRREGFPGIATISIRTTDINWKPTGADLTSATIDGSTLTDSNDGDWYDIILPHLDLTSGTYYAIILSLPSGTYYNNIRWFNNAYAGLYADGWPASSHDGGTTWAANPDTARGFECWDYEAYTTPKITAEAYPTGDHTDDVAYGIYWLAQSFTLNQKVRITSVRLKLFRAGNPGTVTIGIRALDKDDKPTGADLTSGTIDGNTLTLDTNGDWYQINLTPYTLIYGHKYAIVIRAPNGNVSNVVNWRMDSTLPTYARGYSFDSSNSGTSWLMRLISDFMFEIQGYVAAMLYRRRRLSGVWEDAEMWTNGMEDISGISVLHWADWNVLLTGQDRDNSPGIFTCVFGDGYSQTVGKWRGLADIVKRTITEPYEYTAPSLDSPDVFRCFFVEHFTQPEEEYRLYWSHSLATADYISNLWREPVPFNLTAQYGLTLIHSPSHAWLTSANKVYWASLTAAGGEITDDVLEIDFRQNPKTKAGYCKIVLDNTGGKYNGFNNLGWEVKISPGYYTSIGAEYSPGPAFWVTDYKFVSPPWYALRAIYPPGVMGTLYLYTEDQWKMLKRWKARRKYSWAIEEKNIFQMLSFLFARVGLEFEAFSYSSTIVDFKPAFTIAQGSSAYAAVKRLLSYVPDKLFFRGHYAYLINPLADDAVYDTFNSILGVTNLVFRGKYGTSAWEVNKAEVWGDTIRVERHNWDQIEKVFDRLKRVTTPDYPYTWEAAERALAELRTSEVETGQVSSMTCPTHVGLEPWDVIQITDSIAGISNIKRRVLKIKWYFNRKHYAYHQTIDLGAP